MQTEELEGQVGLFDPDTWSGRTCLEPSIAIKDTTSKPSLPKLSKSQSQTLPMCLCLKTVGQKLGVSTMIWEDGALLGDYTMHSFGEYPNEENASQLSQILEDSPLPKYSLSAKACDGILRRAAKRGKGLPQELKEALERQLNETNS